MMCRAQKGSLKSQIAISRPNPRSLAACPLNSRAISRIIQPHEPDQNLVEGRSHEKISYCI